MASSISWRPERILWSARVSPLPTVTPRHSGCKATSAVAKHPDQRPRIERGAAIVLLRAIRPDPCFLACFEVESEREPGRFYAVDHGVGVCDCQDYRQRGATCKHLWTLRLLAALARPSPPETGRYDAVHTAPPRPGAPAEQPTACTAVATPGHLVRLL
jgi:hypothetical protein